jgi:EAL domain-containing protein (putative c-di-GMP-specific phosphodiesterase class I)/AmiR/NasT family two-component response regulator
VSVSNAAISILLLDDEPFMLKLIAHMLSQMQFTRVFACDNGAAALLRVDSALECPDVILLDINMPGMDGVEFVRHLVERHYSGSIILVSGEDERVLQSVEKLVRAHRITVLGRLNKPVEPELLATLLARWRPPLQEARSSARRTFSAKELGAAMSKGELVNYYQPKVAVASGEVVGVETLVRWCHPTEGMIPPDQFIGLAEQSGLIDQLTQLVLSAALVQARAWQDAGLSLRVAVNLSMDNLTDLGFLNYVVDLVAKSGVAPQQMVLEVTESRLMHDQRVALEILTRLRLNRFRLSIDDFGTGNSSLTQLRDIPFDELKIDQSFVHGASGNETQRAMFDASLGLARQLKMESVAEGVEDRADWNFVRQSGCDLAQGNFIAKSMPAEDFSAWLVDWEVRRPQLIEN